ncbi:unnamed protein product [Caenorhabditis angaria]|uniref:Uncharacterized protein n=1 Tax=Caenorhabditis angaria TaxID=860376 RepID=A0A9P1IUU3_9PELO|nr:unnamed protein product [Caenorhabditis angaria]
MSAADIGSSTFKLRPQMLSKIKARLEQGEANLYIKKVLDRYILIKETHLNCDGIIAGTMIIDSKKLADELAKHLLSEYVDSIRSKDRERLFKVVQKSSYELSWCDYEYETYHYSKIEEKELEKLPDELVNADIEKRIDVKVKSTILEDKTIVIDVES